MKLLARIAPVFLALACGSLLVIAGARAVLGWRATRAIPARQQAMESLEAEVRRLRDEAARPDIEIRGEGVGQRYALPEHAPRLALVALLEQVAKDESVALAAVDLSPRSTRGYVRASVRAEGTPDALVRFIRAIEANREALVVSRLRLHVNPEGTLRLEATIVAHGRIEMGPAVTSEENDHD